MSKESRTISLGFAEERLPEGTHICQVFTDEAERVDSLLKFLLCGLLDDDRTACFSERITEDEIRTFLTEKGISYDERREQEAFSLEGAQDIYFKDGRFDPDRMLNLLKAFYENSINEGFAGARVIGEMLPEVERAPGGDRLLEYEARVSLMVRKIPLTLVCQYDANLFDGATIMDVLKVHPKMLVNGTVVRNPFFVEPETFLAGAEADG